MLDFGSEIGFGSFSHFNENHGRDFFGVELFMFSFVFNLEHGFSVGSRDNFERPEFHVFFDNGVVEFSSDKSFGVEDRVDGISGHLILGGISDVSFDFGETNIRGSGSVTLIIGNDFNFVVLIDTHTRIGGTKIDSDGGSFSFVV